jgi:hypothetical protein
VSPNTSQLMMHVNHFTAVARDANGAHITNLHIEPARPVEQVIENGGGAQGGAGDAGSYGGEKGRSGRELLVLKMVQRGRHCRRVGA